MKKKNKISESGIHNPSIEEYDPRPWYILASIIPLGIWVIIVYFFWYQDKTSRWEFGKSIIIILLIPFIHFLARLPTLLSNTAPLRPDFKMCFNSLPGKGEKWKGSPSRQSTRGLKKMGILGIWNATCEELMKPLSRKNASVNSLQGNTVGMGLLLLGLVSTAFRKENIFNVRLIRNFSAVSMILTTILNTVSVFGEINMVKRFIMVKTLIGLQVLNVTSFLIVILGFFNIVILKKKHTKM